MTWEGLEEIEHGKKLGGKGRGPVSSLIASSLSLGLLP